MGKKKNITIKVHREDIHYCLNKVFDDFEITAIINGLSSLVLMTSDSIREDPTDKKIKEAVIHSAVSAIGKMLQAIPEDAGEEFLKALKSQGLLITMDRPMMTSKPHMLN